MQFPYDELYMRRALQLAANGRGFTRSNPMVGAVIVGPDGRVIGEGWHRKYGQGHAEVNAVASVREADRPLLKESTIYVSLEPCSHYGKTPPCAKLLIDTGIPQVVVGATDPNPKVNGRGIAMLRQSGAKVMTGVLADESIALNKVFFTSQTLRRPFIYLKWAQSADGFLDIKRLSSEPAFTFSDSSARQATMKQRAECQAIMTTAATFAADHPRLTLRNREGIQPLRFIYDRSDRLKLAAKGETDGFILLSPSRFPDYFSEGRIMDERESQQKAEEKLAVPFNIMYKEFGITSVMVEAGPRYLSALLGAGLWDELRVEISPVKLGEQGAHPAPVLPENCLVERFGRFSYFRREKQKVGETGKL